MFYHSNTILHVDVDAFAVAVERRLDPKLSGRPVVVGHEAGGRGLVSCASYEARRQGVRAGMPVALARRRLPHATFLTGNPTEYWRFSQQLFEFLASQAPVAEQASVDDIYLDLTGCGRLFGGSLAGWAWRLGRRVRAETGLPVSMGLATNKLVARVATLMAKPGHLACVPPGCEAQFLGPAALGLLPGAGRECRTRLLEMGIAWIDELAALDEETARLLLGPPGGELWRRARGECRERVNPTPPVRWLAFEHAFEADTADPAAVEGAAVLLAQRIAQALRAAGACSARGELSLVHSDGGVSQRAVRLARASCHDGDWLSSARKAALTAFHRRVRVRRVILRAPCQAPAAGEMADLFDTRASMLDKADAGARAGRNTAPAEETPEAERLCRAMDAVRTRHGFRALVPARALFGLIPSIPPAPAGG